MEVIYEARRSELEYGLCACTYPDCFECGKYCGGTY